MYGKRQTSGLFEIVPLTGTSVFWGQYPMFSHPESSQGALLGAGRVAAGADGFMGVSPVSVLSSSQGSWSGQLWYDGLLAATSFVYRHGRQLSFTDRSQPPSLLFGRDSKTRRGAGKLYSGKERERRGFAYAPTGGCWPGEGGGRKTSSRASSVIG